MELTGNKLSPYFQAVEAVLNVSSKEFTFTESGDSGDCVLASEPELKDGEASVKGAFAIFEHLFKVSRLVQNGSLLVSGGRGAS